MATRYIQSFSICDTVAEVNTLPLNIGTAFCSETHCWYDSQGGWHKSQPGDVSGLATASQGALADSAVQPSTLNSALSLKANISSLAPVALSGVYNDLSGKPTLGTAAAQNTGAFATATQGSKADTAVQPGSLAAVATSGSYNDLSSKPTTPAAQGQSDWNSVSGISQIANKPTLGTAAAQDVGAFATSAQGTKADNAAVASTTTSALAGKAALIAYYNAAGAVNAVVKKWVGIVTPNTASGHTIDISSAGFSTILNVQIIGIRNTAIVTSSPNVSIKSVSTTQVVVNITEGSALTQTIAGITVLLGLPVVFANITGLTLQVMVEGY